MKVYLVYEEYADYANHEFENYLRLVCSSEANAKQMCRKLAEELAESSTEVEAYVSCDSEYNPTTYIRHANRSITESHFTIEEWDVC